MKKAHEKKKSAKDAGAGHRSRPSAPRAARQVNACLAEITCNCDVFKNLNIVGRPFGAPVLPVMK